MRLLGQEERVGVSVRISFRVGTKIRINKLGLPSEVKVSTCMPSLHTDITAGSWA